MTVISFDDIRVGDKVRATNEWDGLVSEHTFTVVRKDARRAYYRDEDYHYLTDDDLTWTLLERPKPAIKVGDRVRRVAESDGVKTTIEFEVGHISPIGTLLPKGRNELFFNPRGFEVLDRP